MSYIFGDYYDETHFKSKNGRMVKWPYRWIITKDHIHTEITDEDDDIDDAVGVQGPGACDETLKDNPQRFSLYDDDGTCYAEGMLYSTDAAYNDEDALFSPLMDYGLPNWGCSAIKVDGELIGF